MLGEVALARHRRCDLYVRRLFRPQPVAQCVEDRPLAEASHTSCIVGRQVLGTRNERADAELLGERVAQAVQPSECSRIATPTVTIAAGVTNDQKPAAEYLILAGLTRRHTAAAAGDRRRGGRARDGDEDGEKRNSILRALNRPSHHVPLLVESIA